MAQVKEKDIKLLWGRAANRCAICRTELSQDSQATSVSFPIGEQAHIVGEATGGPRGSSPLTSEERNTYHNLVLLCPTHHTEVDKNVSDWPVERLHYQKSLHELWVRETLSETTDQRRLAEQVAVTYVVDSAVELCWLENWKTWTELALAADPIWPHQLPDQIFEFRQRAGAAIWPSAFDELRRATITLATYLNAAAQNFLRHARYSGAFYVPIKFYKEGGHNPDYDRDLELYKQWIHKGFGLLRKAAAAANWFADIVRRDLNPMFFAKTGKFVVLEGPFLDLSVHAKLYELPEAERATLPGSIDADV